MKTKRLFTAFAIATVVLTTGCKKDDYEEKHSNRKGYL